MDCFYLFFSQYRTRFISLRHMYTMKLEAVVSSHFRCFHPLSGTVIQKKKSLDCINLQCNKDFLGNELTAIPHKTFKQDPVRLLKTNIFKNVLSCTRSHMEEELWTCFKSKNWAAPVPSVLHSPHPTPETRREWNHARSRPPQHTHHTLNSSFPQMFQIVPPNVRSRDPLWPASNNKIHMPSFSPIRKRTL